MNLVPSSSQVHTGAEPTTPPGRLEDVKRLLAPLLVFALIIYLAFTGGGFDSVVFGRVGIAAWWLVLLGVLLGAFSLDRLPRSARIAFALLAAFALWTGLSMLWSESAARSAEELARAVSYLGVFVLTAAVQRRNGLRLTLGAVAAAVGVVAAVSLLSRMEPEWFPENETIDLLFAAEARLNYPLNYWNGLAAMMAIGAPLLIHFATHGRNTCARGLAAAALPAIGLGLYLTLSRGGWLALIAAVLALVALHPRRRALLPQLALAVVGSAILIWAAESRDEFMVGLRVGEGLTQGDEVLAITLVVCLIAGLAQFAIRAAADRRTMPSLRPPDSSPRTRLIAVGAVLVVAIGLAFAADLPAKLDSGWEQFKEPSVARYGDRLESASGNGRYQWWSAAYSAFESQPVGGIGSGTFEFWWSRRGSLASPVVNAHSLFAETLGELGIIGLILIVGVIGGLVLLCGRLTLRAPPPRRRRMAAATAACVAFAGAAATDWAWELPIVPICFLIVAGAALGARRPAADHSDGRLWMPLAGTALVGIIVIGLPLLATDAIRSSQDQVRAGELESALDDARRARTFEPYSGPAALQEALVLEAMGRLGPAREAAEEAIDKESTNWQNWLILARIESLNARSRQAVAAYRRAARLRPASGLLQEPGDDGE